MFSVETIHCLLNIINKKSLEPHINENELLIAVNAHHISGRILSAISKRSDNCFSNTFLVLLKKEYEKEFAKVNANISSINELVNRYNFPKLPIAIKGYTYYVLTSDKSSIRSGDVDLLPSNIESFICALTASGYKRTRMPFMHEAGEFCKKEVEVDVHCYFPVYRYDDQLRRMTSTSDMNFKHFGMLSDHIDYSDLYEYSYYSSENKNVVVVDANMSILIMCAHMFMNYTNIWSISHREKPYVKLGELMDVFELTNHFTYSSDIFLNLIKRYNAYDCVKWAGILMNMVFGSNPLPLDVKDERLQDYPVCIWWHIWRYIPIGFDQLFSTNWYLIDTIIDNMGSNRITQGTYHSNDMLKVSIGNTNDYTLNYFDDRMELVVPTDIISLRRFRIDFGNYAVEIIMNGNSFEVVGNTKEIDVHFVESIISIMIISRKFLIGIYEETGATSNEIIIPVELEEL